MSAFTIDNPDGKYHLHEKGTAGSHNCMLTTQPSDYYENWIKIWKVLNGIEENTQITEATQIQIIEEIDSTLLEYKEITKGVLANYDTGELCVALNTIRTLKKRQILTINEIIQSIVAYDKIRHSSIDQIRRYAKETKSLNNDDIVVGKYYYYYDNRKKNYKRVKLITIHYDNSPDLYFTVEFDNGNQRQVIIDKLL